MLNNDQIRALFDSLPTESYKYAVSERPVVLGSDIAAALGQIQVQTPGGGQQMRRKLLRILNAIIDAIAGKLFVESITTDIVNTDLQSVVDQWLTKNRWDTLQRKLFRAIVRDGEAFILTSFVDGAPVYNIREAFDGRCGAAYIYGNNEKVLCAINTWYQGNDRYLDVYYADRIEKYINQAAGNWQPRTDYADEQWPVDWTDNANAPLGLALTKFDIGDSDIEDAVQIQDDINQVLLDLLATSKTMGFPQRYVIGTSNPEYLLDQYGNPLFDVFQKPIRRNLTASPGSILVLQGKDTQFGQLPQASVDTSVLDKLLHLITVVTTVPTFYFTGGDFPSGVALVQAESRLNSKVEEHQSELTSPLEELLRLSLRLSNTYANTAYDTATDIVIKWFPPQVETEDLRIQKRESLAKAITLLMGAGAMSTETAVRALHPNFDETQIQNEVAKIHAQQVAL